MKRFLLNFLLISFTAFFLSVVSKEDVSSKFEVYKVDLRKQHIEFFLKDEKGEPFRSFENLKKNLAEKNENLLFAMNGGMYKPDGTPVGLYVENGKKITSIDTVNGSGNFYMKPNGIFYLTADNKAGVVATENFRNTKIRYATQSGPMLVIDGRIHHAFNKDSKNVHIRNGVGVSGTEVYFVISKEKVTFYEMASYFRDHLNCRNALYLDGFVSRMYLPEKKWMDEGGEFGVIIGEVKKR